MAEACGAGCTQEFQRSSWILGHEEPHLFVSAQWRNCNCGVFYIIYRLLMLVAFSVMLGMTIAETGVLNTFIYLNYLGLVALTVDTMLQFFLAIDGYRKFKMAGKVWDGIYSGMRWFLKMEWFITNVATCVAVGAAAWYWVWYFEDVADLDLPLWFSCFAPFVYVVINVVITGIPVRLYHVFHAWIFCLLYTVFLVIYQLVLRNGPLYTEVDWEANPGLALGFCLLFTFVVTTVVWILYFILYKIRVAVFHSATMNQFRKPMPSVSSVMRKANQASANSRLSGGAGNNGVPMATNVVNASPADGWAIARAGSGAHSIDGNHGNMAYSAMTTPTNLLNQPATTAFPTSINPYATATVLPSTNLTTTMATPAIYPQLGVHNYGMQPIGGAAISGFGNAHLINRA